MAKLLLCSSPTLPLVSTIPHGNLSQGQDRKRQGNPLATAKAWLKGTATLRALPKVRTNARTRTGRGEGTTVLLVRRSESKMLLGEQKFRLTPLPFQKCTQKQLDDYHKFVRLFCFYCQVLILYWFLFGCKIVIYVIFNYCNRVVV